MSYVLNATRKSDNKKVFLTVKINRIKTKNTKTVL